MSDITHIGQLTPDPENRRKHTPRNVGTIVDALHEVGAARSIVIDEAGMVLAGNATLEAAAEAGIERVQVVEADGETIVAVRRTGLTAEQKRRLALFDNRAAELAEWDLEQILRDQQEGLNFEGLFREEELAALLAGVVAAPELLTDPDAIPPAEEVECRTKRGEVWACAEDVARLMGGERAVLCLTDPPYGVDYDPNWRNEAADKGLIAHADRRVGEVTNDHRADWQAAWELFGGDVAYCWHSDLHAGDAWQALLAAGFEIRAQIIWAKSRFAISRGHYNFQHEPCFYAVRKGATASWCGDHSQTTLWEITLDANVEGGHSTQKPVECMARAIRNHEGAVYDPFLGSGTTMIAAEQLNRRCFGMEIEPKYADICLTRWERATNQHARRVE